MVFSSLGFIFLFLPVVIIVYFFIKPEYANLWLFLSSLGFYYIADKSHMGLFLVVILTAYISGIILEKCKWIRLKKITMVISVIGIVSVMFYYKYCDFIIENLNFFFEKSYKMEKVILPVGISFFCFQAISYVVDVYRGSCALSNPVDMALYISFFPQLIAGPIVRFHDVNRYLRKEYRYIDIENMENGIWRFCIGLSKKVILSNNLGGLADIIFAVHDISQFSVMYCWLGAIGYTLQIYFDFSGYSDMAIGLGQIFGFYFQENFDYPYTAKSIRDFWRRWHISLSQFFRDYIYIPIGGGEMFKD